MQETAPTPEAMQRFAKAWASSAGLTTTVVGSSVSGDFKTEIGRVRHAALQGDAGAIARLYAFGQAMAAAEGGTLPFKMPDPADVVAARNGDPAAIERLRPLIARAYAGQQSQLQEEKQNGLQADGFVSFHPPLKRRLVRLERMGARISLPDASGNSRTIRIIVSVFLAPLITLVVAVVLMLIAAMTMLSLLLLTLWLGAIHGIFSLLAHH